MRLRHLLQACLLGLQPLSPSFEPIQPETFRAGGAFVNAFSDFDGDGDADLFVGFNGLPNRLYRNEAGRFHDVAGAVGVADARATRAAAWGDIDADGDPDLLVGFTPGPGSVLRLYRNDGGRFVDVTAAAGLLVDSGAVRQPVWVDPDGDGDLDLYVAFRDRPNMLFRNDVGRFHDVGSEVGLADPRKSVGGVWFDYDEDGDLDLYQANMDGDANGLWQNNGGQFTDVAAPAGLAWGGRPPANPANGTVRPCVGDVDGDGHLDLVTANYGPLGLFLNRGTGRFEDQSSAWGVAIEGRYDTCALADFNNDGRLDLYVNGTVTGGTSYRDYLFVNRGDRFEDVTPPNILALAADHGALWVDVDLDGDLDLALAGASPEGMHLVLGNQLTAPASSRSVSLVMAGSPGSEIRFFVPGTHRLLGTRWVDAGSGYDAQSIGPIHFGLPSGVRRVDVEVIDPARGRQVLTKFRAGPRKPARVRSGDR